MSERRKPSTRYRGEPPPKRRISTPPQAPKQTKPEPIPAVEIEEGLPTKLRDGQPLPTLTDPQAPNLPVGLFQDIASSGVLAASIARSRQKWLIDGVFEKYWTKVSKKKALAEVQNPAKESMTKLGICSMIIEPHVFEITLYSVRENQYTFLPPVGQPARPAPNSAGPFRSPHEAVDPLSHHIAPNFQSTTQPQRQHHTNAQQPVLPPFREGFAQFEPTGLPLPSPTSLPISRGILPPLPQGSTSAAHAGGKGITSQTDPVIQMLAARAATDHALKSLMKVVASGKASQSQLRTFQNKLDELNEIIQKNPPQANNFESTGTAQRNDMEGLDKVSISSAHDGLTGKPSPENSLAPLLPGGPVKTEPLSSYYSQPPLQASKYKGSIPVRQDISAVVFDFTTGNGDRFLFPKYSILEYLPGNTQVLASFLITRTGSTAAGGSYQTSVEYYQPVTIRLSTHNPRTLEQLARVVAPPEEVRARMIEIMRKMCPAENVYLPTQLPRASEIIPLEARELPAPSSDDTFKRTYSPPNSLLPLYSAANA